MPAFARLYLFLIVTALLAPCCFAAAARPVIIATPAGGEFFVIGSQQRVRLDPKTKAKSITLELSRDGGATFAALGTIDNLVKDKTLRNVLAFTVTAPASGQCVIRATADGVSSTSSGFTIGTSAVANGALTVDQINSGTATTGNVLSADGNGGTTFSPLIVNSGQITSGPASSGNVLVSDGSGGSSFQSLNGTFVRVAGDNMTGALNVAGTVGVGTTTPRETVEINGATAASLSVNAGAGSYVRWRATTTAFLQEFVNGSASNPVINADFSSGSVRYGALSGTGAFTVGSNNSIVIDGSFSFKASNFTANFSANDNTCVFFCNSASNSITITLPDAANRTGRIYIVKKTSANNNVTIATTGGRHHRRCRQRGHGRQQLRPPGHEQRHQLVRHQQPVIPIKVVLRNFLRFCAHSKSPFWSKTSSGTRKRC